MPRAVIVIAALLVAAHLAGADEPKKDPKPTNEIISDLVDKPASFKGKTICLQLAFVSTDLSLDNFVGDKNVLFTATDPNNGAKLRIGLDIPKGLEVPKAKGGEQLVVTFECTEGSTSKGNKVTSITRPKKAKG